MLGPRKRSCTARKADGSPCGANPMIDEQFCFSHHPDYKQEAAAARRLGGLRRRREKTIEGAYDLNGLRSPTTSSASSRPSPSISSAWSPPSPAPTPYSGPPASPPGCSKPANSSAASPTSKPPLRTARPNRHRHSMSICRRSSPQRSLPSLSPLNRHLKDLDDHLSPTDIVLRELREMARFRSMTEYLASLGRTDPPLNRMTRQARRAVEKSMKGMPSDEIEERVREAVRDVLFLWHLYLKLNDRVEVGLRVAQPTIAWLYSDYRRILLHLQLSAASCDFPFRSIPRPPPRSTPRSPTKSNPGPPSAIPVPSSIGPTR